MKNVIKYYYGLDVSYIRQVNNMYYLLIDNNNYVFTICDTEELENIEKYVFNNPNYNKLIYTSHNTKYVNYNNTNYALFKINTLFRKITLDDVLNSFQYVSNDNLSSIKNNWLNLWKNNVDYVEYNITQNGNKYNEIKNIAFYYIGMAENAIQLLNDVMTDNIDKYVVHKRVNYDMNLVDLYNPCYAIIDTRVRDIAEYFKSLFFFDYSLFLKNIEKLNRIIDELTNTEKIMLFIRFLYPSYFFDIYNKVILKEESIDALFTLSAKSEEYEKFLKNLQSNIKKTVYFNNIDWL